MSRTETIRTTRLTLAPLTAANATVMAEVLSDPALYTFTGGEPPSPSELEELYRYQSAGSPGDDEDWFNWIVHLDGATIGFVQATVTGKSADLAWVLESRWQGAGYATEAAIAMRNWLADQGVNQFSAHIHTEHAASQGIAVRFDLRPSGLLDDDGTPAPLNSLPGAPEPMRGM